MAARIPSLAVQREAKRSTVRVHSLLAIEAAREALDDGNAELVRAHLEQMHRDATAVLDGDECAAVERLKRKVA